MGRMPLKAAVLTLLTALVLLGAGCGKSSSSGSSQSGSNGGQASSGSGQAPKKVRFAKTKFVFHAGLAFGAFHRYIYKPFRAGSFSRPLSHKKALLKAAVAALFVVHEVKKAREAAQSSPLLTKLFSPLAALENKVTGLRSSFRGGRAEPAQIDSANSDITSIGQKSASSGAPVRDLPTPALGG